jgi:hypothetical protein
MNEMGGTYSIHAEKRKAYSIQLENLEGRDNLGELGIEGRIIIKWN